MTGKRYKKICISRHSSVRYFASPLIPGLCIAARVGGWRDRRSPTGIRYLGAVRESGLEKAAGECGTKVRENREHIAADMQGYASIATLSDIRQTRNHPQCICENWGVLAESKLPPTKRYSPDPAVKTSCGQISRLVVPLRTIEDHGTV